MRAQPNDLARVVSARIAELGVSHQAIADRTRLAASYVSRVASGAIARPEDERLVTLAAGLELDVRILQAAMHRAPQPESEAQADLPPDLVAAFSRVQRYLSNDELKALHTNLRDFLDMVSRPYAEGEYGPTRYRPDAGARG
jgi:transcriptional regulator with XRE-family HTH domain